MAQSIYKFHWDCGRQGNLDGIFVAEDEEVENIIGKEVHFGEVLGKHSEIYGHIEEGEITKVTSDPYIVGLFIEYNMSTGYNPITWNED